MSSDGRQSTAAAAEATRRADYGTLTWSVSGRAPPRHDPRAKDVIQTADCIIASNLDHEFLRKDGTLPPQSAELDGETDDGEIAGEEGAVLERPDGSRQTLIRSSMGKQVELAREAFERVRAGEDIAHVSGGDPNVYGKSDLLFTMADADDADDVPIEIVPGVTAALSGAANLGAPLSNDFCTISLSDKWRGWDEIEEKLRAAAISGFVVVLYNCWRVTSGPSTFSARSERTMCPLLSSTTLAAARPAGTSTTRRRPSPRSANCPSTTTRSAAWVRPSSSAPTRPKSGATTTRSSSSPRAAGVTSTISDNEH